MTVTGLVTVVVPVGEVMTMLPVVDVGVAVGVGAGVGDGVGVAVPTVISTGAESALFRPRSYQTFATSVFEPAGRVSDASIEVLWWMR